MALRGLIAALLAFSVFAEAAGVVRLAHEASAGRTSSSPSSSPSSPSDVVHADHEVVPARGDDDDRGSHRHDGGDCSVCRSLACLSLSADVAPPPDLTPAVVSTRVSGGVRYAEGDVAYRLPPSRGPPVAV